MSKLSSSSAAHLPPQVYALVDRTGAGKATACTLLRCTTAVPHERARALQAEGSPGQAGARDRPLTGEACWPAAFAQRCTG